MDNLHKGIVKKEPSISRKHVTQEGPGVVRGLNMKRAPSLFQRAETLKYSLFGLVSKKCYDVASAFWRPDVNSFPSMVRACVGVIYYPQRAWSLCPIKIHVFIGDLVPPRLRTCCF